MADQDQISGKIVVEIEEAKKALEQIIASMQQTQQQMQQGFQKTADDSKKASQDISNSIKKMHSDIKDTVSGITSTIAKIGEVAIGVGAILAGGAIFKGVVDEFINMNSESKKLSVVMGTSVGNAQALLESFKKVGISGDDATGTLSRMTRQLKTNEQAFNDNGIKTRDSSGNLLSMNEILFNSVDRLKEMKEGTDRNMLATTIFGRAVSSMPGFLKLTSGAVEEMKNHIASLGITLDDISVAKARAYKEGMHDVTLVMDAMKYKIGEQLIPVLIQMAHFLADIGPPAIKACGDALRAIQNFLMGATIIAAQIRDGFLQAWDQIKIGADGAFTAMKATISGNFTEAAAATRSAYAAMKQSSADWKEQAVRDANAVRDSILSAMQAQRPGENLGGFPGAPAPSKEKESSGGDLFVNKDKGGKGGGGGGGPSMVQEWQNELDQMKLADKAYQDQSLVMEKEFWAKKLSLGQTATKEEEDALKSREQAAAMARLQAEKSFWTGKLALTEEGSKEYIDVQHKIVTLDQQVNKTRLQSELDLIKSKMAANQESIKDRQAQIDLEGQLDKINLEMKRANIDYLGKVSKLSKAQELQEYKALLLQEQALDLQRAQQKAALDQGDKVKFQKHQNDILLLKKKQQLDLEKIDQQISIAEESVWSKAFDNIGSSFTSLLGTLESNTKDMMGAITSFFKSIGQGLANMFMQMGMEWVKAQLLAMAATKTAATEDIMASAGKAGAAGSASVFESVPFPYNLAIAPAIGLAAAGVAKGFASFEVGAWEIPSRMIAQLHPGEMVVPAGPAEGLRQMMKGGNAGGGAGSENHFHINISAVDAAGVQALFMRHGDVIARALNRELMRFGKAPLSPSHT